MSPAIVAQAVKSYSYVVMWMSISITVILFNKWLLAYAGFPFPISLTLWHMFFCSTVGFLCVRVFKVRSFVPALALRSVVCRRPLVPRLPRLADTFPLLCLSARLLAQPVNG